MRCLKRFWRRVTAEWRSHPAWAQKMSSAPATGDTPASKPKRKSPRDHTRRGRYPCHQGILRWPENPARAPRPAPGGADLPAIPSRRPMATRKVRRRIRSPLLGEDYSCFSFILEIEVDRVAVARPAAIARDPADLAVAHVPPQIPTASPILRAPPTRSPETTTMPSRSRREDQRRKSRCARRGRRRWQEYSSRHAHGHVPGEPEKRSPLRRWSSALNSPPT